MKDKKVQITLQVFQSIVDRIEALIDPMSEDMRRYGGEASRAAVIRAVLYEGIDRLERQYINQDQDVEHSVARAAMDDSEDQ